jgi:hypothetical protein
MKEPYPWLNPSLPTISCVISWVAATMSQATSLKNSDLGLALAVGVGKAHRILVLARAGEAHHITLQSETLR